MNREILRLAIPNIVSNISVPLLSAVDVALMGNLSVTHLGAIGLATMIFNFFFWNFGFLRMGTTGQVAQAHGANNENKINALLSQALYLALGISVIIIVLQEPIGSFAIWALGVGESHQPLVREYFNIRIWAAPASLMTYCLIGWLFGRQNAVVPMIVTLSINLLNIVLSYIMVVQMDFGITGVAIGTVSAEYMGLFLLLWVIKSKYRFRLQPFRELLEWSRFFTVNRDLFIRTLALTTAFAFFYRQSSIEGGVILATNVVLLQFLSWMSYGIDGFAYASESLVGMQVGRKDKPLLLKTINYSFIWGVSLAIFFGIAFYFLGYNIATIFTNDFTVLNAIASYDIWLLFLPLIAFSCYMWDGIFIGLTLTKQMRDSMLWSILLFVSIFYSIPDTNNNAIWIGFNLFLIIRGVMLTFYWFRIDKSEIMDL